MLFGRAYFGICCCLHVLWWLQCLIDQVVQSLCSAMMIVLISKLIRSTFGNWSTCWWTSFESASRKYKILQSVGGCVWINKHAIIWLFSFTSLLTGGTFRPDPARPHFGSLKHWNRSYHEHRTFSGTPGLVVNTNVNQFQLPTLCLSLKEYHTMSAWWPCGWEHAAPKRWRHCVSRLRNITSNHTSKVLDLVPKPPAKHLYNLLN